MCLQGNAQDAYCGLDDVTKADWALLCAALERRFHPASVARFKRVELMHHQQQPGESVLDYATVIQHLSRGACMRDNEGARHEWMREFFLNGLTRRLRESILNGDPATFEDAVALAQRHEANLHLVQGTTPSHGGCYAGFLSSRDPSQDSDHNQSGGSQMGFRGNPNRRRAWNGNRGNGRWSQNRGQFYGGFRDRNLGMVPRSRWTDDGRPICDNCQGIGHLKMHCLTGRGGQGQGMSRDSGMASPYGGQGASATQRSAPEQRQGQWAQGGGQWNQRGQGSGNRSNGRGTGPRGQATRGTYRGGQGRARGGRINVVAAMNGTMEGSPEQGAEQNGAFAMELQGQIEEREHQIRALQEQVNQLQEARYPEFVGMVRSQSAASGPAAALKPEWLKASPEKAEQFANVMAELKQKRKCVEPEHEHPVMVKRGVPVCGIKAAEIRKSPGTRQWLADEMEQRSEAQEGAIIMPKIEEQQAVARVQSVVQFRNRKTGAQNVVNPMKAGKPEKWVPPITTIVTLSEGRLEMPKSQNMLPPGVVVEMNPANLLVEMGPAREWLSEGAIEESKGQEQYALSQRKQSPLVKKKESEGPEVQGIECSMGQRCRPKLTIDGQELPMILAAEMNCEPLEEVVQEKPQQERKIGPPIPPKPLKTFRGVDDGNLKQAAMLTQQRRVAKLHKGADDRMVLLLHPEKLPAMAEEDEALDVEGISDTEIDSYLRSPEKVQKNESRRQQTKEQQERNRSQ